MGKSINSKKMFKNTFMLYIRQIVILVINLVSVRILLHSFGEDDYGLYTLIAGIASMFSILSGAMSSASQRFYSFYMGQDKYDELKKCVWTSLIVYVLIAVVVFLFAETVGVWYVQTRLIVPVDRIHQVIWLYQFSIISLILTIFVTPFLAYVISYEDMDIYAAISIIEVVLKLVIAFLIKALNPDIRLAIYGLLLVGVSGISFLSYLVVVKAKYKWKMGGQFDRNLFKEMLSFASWNLFGSAIFSFKNQAVNIVINQNFNAGIVTARGIATSIYSALASFSTNFSNALRPQIVKNYAAENDDELYYFVNFSSKITFLLMFVLMFPFYYDMPFIIHLWLGSIPKYAVEFARLGLIEALIESITLPISPLADATGKIKIYQIVVGGILLFNLPMSIVLIHFIKIPCVVYYISIFLTFLASIGRILCTSKITKLSFGKYIKDVVAKCIALCILLLVAVYGINLLITNSVLKHITSYGVYTILIMLSITCLLFTTKERESLKELMGNLLKKIKRNKAS